MLVNNAGIAGATKKTWEFTPEEWQEVLQVDLFGVFLCCRAPTFNKNFPIDSDICI